jgi:hypothetical protein
VTQQLKEMLGVSQNSSMVTFDLSLDPLDNVTVTEMLLTIRYDISTSTSTRFSFDFETLLEMAENAGAEGLQYLAKLGHMLDIGVRSDSLLSAGATASLQLVAGLRNMNGTYVPFIHPSTGIEAHVCIDSLPQFMN